MDDVVVVVAVGCCEIFVVSLLLGVLDFSTRRHSVSKEKGERKKQERMFLLLSYRTEFRQKANAEKRYHLGVSCSSPFCSSGSVGFCSCSSE